MATPTSKREGPKVASQAEWLAARKELLELPWERVHKEYVFDTPREQREGVHATARRTESTTPRRKGRPDLFGGRSQLIVYHFMFGPEWQEGCPSCSLLSDHIDGSAVHLNARDVTLLVVSRAPLAQIEAFKKRMGWRFKWVSSYSADFNYDYHVSFTEDEKARGKVNYNYDMKEFPSEEAPGASVFYKEGDGDIFHTYSSYGRGLDILIGAYNFLDLVPKGRDEDGLAFTMAWVRHHDRYSDSYVVDQKAQYVPPQVSDSSCCTGEHQS